MGKINFSTMENVTEVIPKEDIEIIDQGTQCVASASNEEVAESLATAISPLAAITSVINHTLGTVDTISKCIAYVSGEKQKTRRIPDSTGIFIERVEGGKILTK